MGARQGLIAYYDGLIRLNLNTIQPTIAVPFHSGIVFCIFQLHVKL